MACWFFKIDEESEGGYDVDTPFRLSIETLNLSEEIRRHDIEPLAIGDRASSRGGRVADTKGEIIDLFFKFMVSDFLGVNYVFDNISRQAQFPLSGFREALSDLR